MARLTGKLKVLVYSDTEASNYPLSKLTDIEEVLSDTSIAQWEPLLIQIADSTTDQAINFNNISTPEYLLLLSDQQVSIKINGSSAILTKKLYLEGTSLSSLSVSNSSGSVANIRLALGK
jgi:hypothetical protein